MSAIDTADRLWSAVVRGRDGCCRSCGVKGSREGRMLRTAGLDAAHIFPRGRHSTRWDERNGLALCRFCASYYTGHPVEWTAFARAQIGRVLYDELDLAQRTLGRPDLDEVIKDLKSKHDRLLAAA